MTASDRCSMRLCGRRFLGERKIHKGEEMGKEYYTLNQIKVKFRSYRDLTESNITDKEYDIFCREIEMIPETIIDTIYEEIYFVLMSAQPGKGIPACYVNLRKRFDVKKKGIVVLSPYIFGALGIDKNGNEKKYCECKDRKIILHEIAHHVLNHSNEDEEKNKIEEKEVCDQVEVWENEFAKKKRHEAFGSRSQ